MPPELPCFRFQIFETAGKRKSATAHGVCLLLSATAHGVCLLPWATALARERGAAAFVMEKDGFLDNGVHEQHTVDCPEPVRIFHGAAVVRSEFVRRFVTGSALLTCLALAAIMVSAGDGPEQPKVSSYAPAEDLIAESEYFLKQIGEALADQAAYDDVKQTIVERDSNTLAVIGLMLAMHDEDHKLKKASTAIMKSAQALAESYEDFDQATAAIGQAKKALSGEGAGEGAGEVVWEAVASMSPLMKQVPVIHAPMKRGATDERRFKRQATKTAGQAAVLAAIAQAAMFNTDHATEEQIPQWEQFCARMRDACGSVNAAVRSGDAARAAEAIVALQQSCKDCHAVFKAE